MQKKKCTITLEIRDAIHFLKQACSSNKDEIFQKMAMTFEYRRTLDDNLLLVFPKFLDTPGLVRIYFY